MPAADILEVNMADYDKKIDDNDKMTLYLDDGTELKCDVIGIFGTDEYEYIALLPEDAGDDDNIFLYRFIMEDDDFDNITLESIESDEEFDKASEAFEDYMEKQAFLDEEG